MAPANLSRLVIDRLDDALAPEAIIRACPSIVAVSRLGEIEAVAGMSIDDKQARLRIEAGRAIIRHPPFIGRNQAAVGCGFLRRIWNRPTLLVGSQAPVDWSKRGRQQTFTGRAVQHEEIAVARALHQ